MINTIDVIMSTWFNYQKQHLEKELKYTPCNMLNEIKVENER